MTHPFGSFTAALRVLAPVCSLLLLGSRSQAQVTILNQDWEGSTAVPNVFGYRSGDATGNFLVQSGAGFNGSKALVLNTTLGTNPAAIGVQLATTSNPNLTISDPNLVNISFDMRATTTGAAFGSVYFYVQSWAGSFAPPRDGTWSILFVPTANYSTVTFNLGALNHEVGNVIPNHQTVQLSWQIDSFGGGWSSGQHSLFIDNIRVTAVPEPGSIALLVGLATIGVGSLRTRRRIQ